jgi:hypothetical protein
VERVRGAVRSPYRELASKRLSARQRRELAPRFDPAAEQRLLKVGRDLSAYMEELVRKHVLAQLPLGGVVSAQDYGTIQRGLEKVQELASARAARLDGPLRYAARKALAQAASEYERITGEKLPGRFAADMLAGWERQALADYQKIVRDQVSEWKGKALEALSARAPLAEPLLDASWLARNRTALAARSINDLFNRAFERYSREGGDETMVWVTMRDDVVRDKHRQLDGQEYDPRVGLLDGILPGSEPNCRCRGIPRSVLRAGSK